MAYKLTHPDAPDVSIDVDTDQAPMYISQGWQTSPHARPIATDQPVDPNAG